MNNILVKKMKKTDMRIANAMIKLLNDKKNKKISDKEIIQNSGVSRSTFYNHFKNQEEILNFIFNIIDKKIFREFKNINYFPSTIVNKSILIDYLSTNILPIIYEYRNIIKIMYLSDISNVWNNFLEDKYSKEVCLYLNIENNMHLRLFVKYILLIIELWITDETVEKPKQFKKHFKNLCLSPIINIK